MRDDIDDQAASRRGLQDALLPPIAVPGLPPPRVAPSRRAALTDALKPSWEQQYDHPPAARAALTRLALALLTDHLRQAGLLEEEARGTLS